MLVSYESHMIAHGLGFGITLPFGVDELLLGERSEEFIRVLAVAQSDHGCGVDLVENCNFGVVVGIGIERSVFEVFDSRFDLWGIISERANSLDSVLICTVGQLDCRIVFFRSRSTDRPEYSTTRRRRAEVDQWRSNSPPGRSCRY